MKDNTTPASVAVLGTLAEFHRQPIPYDLSRLVELVKVINPDLLCLDISMEEWQRQKFECLPPEYGEALLPLAYQTDIVVVPIGDQRPRPSAVSGQRNILFRWLRGWLAWLQQSAPGPGAINQGWRHHLGNLLYGMARWLAGRETQNSYRRRIETLTEAVREVARRNPGNRILVVTNIQYCHHIRPRLRQDPGIRIKTYEEL